MLRSDHMAFCDLYLQPEAAFEIISQLGEISCVQFLDSAPDSQSFQKTYITEVSRCAEMERKLRYMEAEMGKDNIYIPELDQEPKAMQPNEMLAFENMFEKWENDISQMAEYHVSLMKNYLEMNEMYYMLSHIGPMLGNAELTESWFFKKTTEGVGPIGIGGRLAVMTGVVRRAKCFHFEMMLWRISRGNIYYRQAARDTILQDPFTGQEIRKVAFVAICQGEQLASRMEKVFSGFGVNSYPCPQTEHERNVMLHRLDVRLTDLEEVLNQTKHHRCKALRTVGKQWRSWVIQVKKAKAIYHTMNMFNMDVTKKCLIGQCWVPSLDVKRVQDILEYCTQVVDTNVPSFMYKTVSKAVPPTYYRTNKFTNGFQVLIRAYGESAYRELNPGLYAVVTFPFLFAVMFGDVGHSIIILSMALWMVRKEKQFMSKKSDNEIWNIIFGGRYVLLLLGVFSFFTGFVYNDYFGRGLVLSHSYWYNTYTEVDLANTEILELSPADATRKPYLFGFDPLWELSKNKVMIDNSIKMKLSIIIGVVHMIFGLVLSVFNHIYFKRYYLIYLQFIPQILFLTCLFFWLVILIYLKWFKYNPKGSIKLGSSCAPPILILFIDMFLFVETKAGDDDCEPYMFASQQMVQNVLMIIALLCIPVLLFGNPVYKYLYNKRMREDILKKRSPFRRYQYSKSDKIQSLEIQEEVAQYMVAFPDLMIIQGVHTIEFILGTISHTASYLRLWALSIAHAQLTDMLWVMLLSKLGLREHTALGFIHVTVIFAAWATFTITIMVVMEGLSAFLHTLRLHWVEFMSKFYISDGIPFQPFCFQTIFSKESEKIEGARHNVRKFRDVHN
ncbi:V-type proton ATPase 116 kDa subunit a1 [Manduca sexta]|uniref:V-type proton ATPase 116 kDa subunit a1 n=1 Tax=Manduca sexta TaxID=7130 RepID=UPI00188F3B42|nr:V-type proton ATPase 116 kDa subunit a1 [Manduca sexta]